MKLHVLIALVVCALGCSKDEAASRSGDTDKVEQPKGGNGLIPFSANLTTKPVDLSFKPNASDSWNMENSVCAIRNQAYATQCGTSPPPTLPKNAGETAHGSGTVTYDPATQTLNYTYKYEELSGSPLMMHFHLDQDVGALNPIVQTVCGLPHGEKGKGIGHSAGAPTSGDACPTGTSGTVKGTYKLDGNITVSVNNRPLSAEDEIKALMAGKLYLNIHTCLHPLGEVNGPLTKL